MNNKAGNTSHIQLLRIVSGWLFLWLFCIPQESTAQNITWPPIDVNGYVYINPGCEKTPGPLYQPAPNWTVVLSTSGGNISYATTTDMNGYYEFHNINHNGVVTITLTPSSGYTFLTPPDGKRTVQVQFDPQNNIIQPGQQNFYVCPLIIDQPDTTTSSHSTACTGEPISVKCAPLSADMIPASIIADNITQAYTTSTDVAFEEPGHKIIWCEYIVLPLNYSLALTHSPLPPGVKVPVQVFLYRTSNSSTPVAVTFQEATFSGSTIQLVTPLNKAITFINPNALQSSNRGWYARVHTATGVSDPKEIRWEYDTSQVTVEECPCIGSFAPDPGRYVVSGWVKVQGKESEFSYKDVGIEIVFKDGNTILTNSSRFLIPNPHRNPIIDGWQRLDSTITVPPSATSVEIALLNGNTTPAFFDDIRFHPVDANMSSYVYDPVTLRLAAELDENNYATIYEYDQEGQLARVKRETERGIVTIKEVRASSVKSEGP